MKGAIVAFLAIIAQLAPSIGIPSVVVDIITALENLVPFIIKEVQEVGPLVQNVINALRGNSTVTPEQNLQLDALEEKLDAAFEAAAATPIPDEMQD